MESGYSNIGVIEETGEGVSRELIGQRVASFSGHAQYVTCLLYTSTARRRSGDGRGFLSRRGAHAAQISLRALLDAGVDPAEMACAV